MKKSVFLVTPSTKQAFRPGINFLTRPKYMLPPKGRCFFLRSEFHQLLVFKAVQWIPLLGCTSTTEFACHNWLLNDSIYYLNKEQTRETFCFKFVLYFVLQTKITFLLLCLFFLSLFTLVRRHFMSFFFFPLGIASKFLWVNTIVYYFFTEG